jgi:hypothetical protein
MLLYGLERMFQSSRDNSGIVIIVNIILSYGIYNLCASILWQYIIYDDAHYNIEYDTDSYWLMSTIIGMGLLAYIMNFAQLIFMTVLYSRHFGCIGTVINKFVFIYIWVVISAVENNGCKDREWLSCYKNDTIIVNNDGLAQSKILCGYGIAFLFFLEVVFCICSYIKNKNDIYYFYPDCCREITVMIMFHYSVAIVYSLLPLLLWCGLCLLDDTASSNESGGNVYFDYIHTGRSYPNKAIRKEQVTDATSVDATSVDVI